MDKIQMVDLVGQYEKIKPQIDSAINEVLDTGAYINGPSVKNFCLNLQNYLSVNHVIPCGNGTDALQIALMALDLKPGDEIITTPFTFISTAEVIALLGLNPVFVDVDPNTFNIDPSKIEEVITSKTKVIIPVHLFGQSADMDAIMKIAHKHDLKIVEDAAQAVNAKFEDEYLGTIGDIGCYSFHETKNYVSGEGGAILINNKELMERAEIIWEKGTNRRKFLEEK